MQHCKSGYQWMLRHPLVSLIHDNRKCAERAFYCYRQFVYEMEAHNVFDRRN